MSVAEVPPLGVLTTAYVAGALGASVRAVQYGIAAGTIKSIRLGRLRRIPRSELERLLAEGTDNLTGRRWTGAS